jgi:hypothetical protein
MAKGPLVIPQRKSAGFANGRVVVQWRQSCMSHPDPHEPPDRTPIQIGEVWENPMTAERVTILELPHQNPERWVSRGTPNSHIFISGDIPFISFLLPELGVVVGPCAPTPCTSNESFTLPAFSNSRMTGTLSPRLSGLLRSRSIR